MHEKMNEERSKNVTDVIGVSAMVTLSHWYLYSLDRDLMIGASSEDNALAQPNEWMNTNAFLKWVPHLPKFSKLSKES